MNADQLSDILKEITKRFDEAYSVKSQKSRQEQFDSRSVLSMAMKCVNNNTNVLLIDVVEIITIYLLRGTKISKMNESVNEIGKQRIDILRNKYKLKDFASSEDVASGKALSLRKLVSAFPYQLLLVMKSEKYPRPLGKETLNFAKAPNFPGFLKSTNFLSVIPFPTKQLNENRIWSPDQVGINKFITIIHGVIAYEFLESFIVHKWGNNDTAISPSRALSNVISVAQNILHSNFINQKIREDNYLSMFQNELNSNFKAIENLVNYTENKYNGFKYTLNTHLNYNIKNMKFDCRAKVFCRHVER